MCRTEGNKGGKWDNCNSIINKYILKKIEGQIKCFPDKRSLKEYTSTKPALQEMLKDFRERKEKRKREENSWKKWQ